MEGKFKQIKKNFTQCDRREQIEKKREIAIEKFEKELNKTIEDGKKVLTRKPWAEEHFNKTFTKEVEEINTWFTENSDKQKEMSLYDVNKNYFFKIFNSFS